jgi:hypothetical protein
MVIPTIESRASKISRDKGNGIFDTVVQTDKRSLVSMWESLWISMVPLLIIDRRSVSVMSTYSRTRRVTHLTLDVARVEMRYQIW